jgi:hypothetical protein
MSFGAKDLQRSAGHPAIKKLLDEPSPEFLLWRPQPVSQRPAVSRTGARVKRGFIRGATDGIGYHGLRTASTSTISTPRRCTCLGSTTRKLTYKFSGRDFRLTDVAGMVAKKIIA